MSTRAQSSSPAERRRFAPQRSTRAARVTPRPRAQRRRAVSRASRRQHLLAADDRVLGAVGDLPLRELRVERDVAAVGDPRARATRAHRRRVHGRRPRSELHVHHRAPAEHRVHRRHPAPERRAAPDVQGADRDVEGPRRVPREAVLARAARGCRYDVVGRRAVRGARASSHPTARATARTCARSPIVS